MKQDHTPELRMENALREYFHGEKNGGLILMIWGCVGLAIAGFLLWKFTGEIYRGAVAPFGVMALVHLTAGAAVFLRTGKQTEALAAQLQNTPVQFADEESQRMVEAMSNFEKYKMAGQVLFFLGGGFIAIGAFLGGGEYMTGSGAGLCFQSFLTLVFGLFASFRGRLYLHELIVFKRER